MKASKIVKVQCHCGWKMNAIIPNSRDHVICQKCFRPTYDLMPAKMKKGQNNDD